MKKVLAGVGILIGILLVVGAIVWVKWGKGLHDAHQLVEKQKVSVDKVFQPLTPEQVVQYRPAPQYEREYLEKTRKWQDTLISGKEVEVPYDTKGVNRLIAKDMISDDVRAESFYLEVKDGFLTGQASIRNPLDKAKETWLNLQFKITITIRNFVLDLAFNELVAFKEGVPEGLSDDGREVVMKFIKAEVQKAINGDEKRGGKASDLYYVKDLELQGNEMKVVYDPARFKEWKAARRAYHEAEDDEPDAAAPAGNRVQINPDESRPQPVQPKPADRTTPQPDDF